MTRALRTARLYSVEEEADGAFSVFPFDEFGRPIPSHPLASASFPDARAAFDAIAAGSVTQATGPAQRAGAG
jgi:hypothetical protein